MRRTRRDLRFDAWFLWMMPRAAALSRRFTARRRSSAEVSAPGRGRGDGRLDPGLDLGLGRLVAKARHLVGPVALDLALDVGHYVLLRSAREPEHATSPDGRHQASAVGAVTTGLDARRGRPPRWRRAGTSQTTTALAPIRAPSPTVMAPRILAPAPMNTSSPMIGRRSPR